MPHKCSNTIHCIMCTRVCVLACSNVVEGILFLKWVLQDFGRDGRILAVLFSKCFHGGKSSCSLLRLQRDTQPPKKTWQQKRINCSPCMRKTSACSRNLHNKDEEDPPEKLLCIHWYYLDVSTVKLPWIIKSATLHNQTAPEYKCDPNLY